MAEETFAEKVSKAQRKQIVDVFRAAMAEGGDWTKGWKSVRPYNAVGQNRYQGMNTVWLIRTAFENGWNDPRWITPNQAKEWSKKLGQRWDWSGQKLTYIEKWSTRVGHKKDEDSEEEDAIKLFTYPHLDRVYGVLNMAQIKGAPAYEAALVLPEGNYSLADNLIDKYYNRQGGPKYHEACVFDDACYVPCSDRVEMPDRKLFKSSEGFLSTFAHETVHSTGHQSRCARKIRNLFGTDGYAFEELVAEFGAIFLCAENGTNYCLEDQARQSHAAYLKHWQEHLDKDGNDLFEAIRLAEKAVDYLEEKLREEALSAVV